MLFEILDVRVVLVRTSGNVQKEKLFVVFELGFCLQEFFKALFVL